MIVGEGAATFILEEREHALARGAKIHAEIVGFGTNADGKHVTQPTMETMQSAMEAAIADADVDPGDRPGHAAVAVDHVCVAHRCTVSPSSRVRSSAHAPSSVTSSPVPPFSMTVSWPVAAMVASVRP